MSTKKLPTLFFQPRPTTPSSPTPIIPTTPIIWDSRVISLLASKIFKANIQQVIFNVSRIFLVRIKVWIKLLHFIVLVYLFLILHSLHTLFLCFSCLEQVILWDWWYHKQSIKKKPFLLFNFAIAKIFVVVRLAVDGATMDGI